MDHRAFVVVLDARGARELPDPADAGTNTLGRVADAARGPRFGGHGGRRHDGPLADVGASALRRLSWRGAPKLPGEPLTP